MILEEGCFREGPIVLMGASRKQSTFDERNLCRVISRCMIISNGQVNELNADIVFSALCMWWWQLARLILTVSSQSGFRGVKKSD